MPSVLGMSPSKVAEVFQTDNAGNYYYKIINFIIHSFII